MFENITQSDAADIIDIFQEFADKYLIPKIVDASASTTDGYSISYNSFKIFIDVVIMIDGGHWDQIKNIKKDLNEIIKRIELEGYKVDTPSIFKDTIMFKCSSRCHFEMKIRN